MTWGTIGGAAVNVVGGALLNSGGGGGGGGGGGQQYVPTDLAGADQTWQNATNASWNTAQGAGNFARPAYDQSFTQSRAIDYSPYEQAAQRSGAAYGSVGDQGMRQMGAYDSLAVRDSQQQDQMYGMAGDIYKTAFDPQHALYDRTQQQLTDQVRAGQAARGLGASAVGGAEENQAMSNFNIDWQNAQLGREATGIQAASQATNSGVNAGRLAGADLSAAMSAGATGADAYGKSGAVPLSAEEYAAGAGTRDANALVQGYQGIQQGYQNSASGTIPYMNAGNGAIQGNYSNQYQQNRDMTGALSQIGQQVAPRAVNWFGGNNWSPDTSTGSGDWTTGSGGYSPYVQADYGGYY